jgi:hypothetical protein
MPLQRFCNVRPDRPVRRRPEDGEKPAAPWGEVRQPEGPATGTLADQLKGETENMTHDHDTVVVDSGGGSSSSAILAIVGIIILLVAVWWFALGPGAGPSSTTTNNTNNTNVNPPAASAPAASTAP